MKLPLSAFVITFFSAVLLQAENWPEWRGPRQDGTSHEKNLPTRWSETENVKWKIELPDRGNSTPVIWENKVFVTQAIESEGKRMLLCFDKGDGKLLWQSGTTYPHKEPSHQTNPQCSASPATDGQVVVAWFGSAGVFCYDFTGKQLWKRDLGKQTHEWGYASSPILYKDLVILNFGPGERSFTIALNKNSGKTEWEVDVEEQHFRERIDGFAGRDSGVTGSWSTPIVVRVKGRPRGEQSRHELINAVPNKMQALDPLTGKELWVCKGMNPLIYTSPVYGEGVVVGMGGFHGPNLAVKPGGKGDVTQTHKLWETGRTQNHLGTGVIKDGYLFVMGMPGIAECLDLKTGKTVWEERLRGKGPKSDSWSSMILVDKTIYILNQSGDTILLKASPTFEVLGVNSIGNEMTNASLAASNGDLLIRTHKHLWCISRVTKTASLE